MSITHDNSGTRRTQAQRDAVRLIEAGEFIAADTPAGQAVIDALDEAAQRVKTRPSAEDEEASGNRQNRIAEEFERAWRSVELGKVNRPSEDREPLLPRSIFIGAISPLEAVARRGDPSGFRRQLNEAAGRISDDILFRWKGLGVSLVTVVLFVSAPSLKHAQFNCHIQITTRWGERMAANITFSGQELVFYASARYHGFIGGFSSSISHHY